MMNPACVYNVLKHAKSAQKGILKCGLDSIGQYTQVDICKTYDFLREKGYATWGKNQLCLTPQGEILYRKMKKAQEKRTAKRKPKNGNISPLSF